MVKIRRMSFTNITKRVKIEDLIEKINEIIDFINELVDKKKK